MYVEDQKMMIESKTRKLQRRKELREKRQGETERKIRDYGYIYSKSGNVIEREREELETGTEKVT